MFIPHRDKQAANDFINAYEKYEEANTAFIVPLFASNLGGENLGRETLVDIANDNVELAIDRNIDVGDPYRIQLAEEAIADNNEIIKLINESDEPQSDCENAQLALNTAAASLKNSEMRKCATGICDIALERHNKRISYKQALLENRKLVSEMMNSIIEDNGKRGKLSSFLIQNKKRIEKINEVIDKTNADYGELTTKIETTYARFKGLAGIQDKQ